MPEHPMEHPKGRTRLAHAVERRIDEMGLDYVDVAREAGFTVETLIKIRKGTKVATRTYRKLEAGLGWATYSVDRVMEGRDPERAPQLITGTRTVDDEPAKISYAPIEEQLQDLTPEEQQSLIDYLADVAELHLRRQRGDGPERS
ncbi:hypothetical protein [Streptomonospora salina]|uniref:Uncharacterized protein n=1 Tax=Streptomonospora salina TaxID=104205 RepID=A0A841EHJ7_9ACTN|nr:hypothetical protein [Streptomonospora salina]MBB6000849.1 hypothetical protein [Streptomonospora salina]